MKRKALFAACLAVIVLCTSCGLDTASVETEKDDKIVLNEDNVVIKSDGIKDIREEPTVQINSIAKNDKKASMPIEIGDKTKICFAAGGTSGYLVLADEDMNYYFQYIDGAGETIETFETQAIADEVILNMAVDKDNNLSLFLIKGKRTDYEGKSIIEVSNEGARIIKIDKNGTLLSEDDISAFFEEKQYNRTDMTFDDNGRCCFTFENSIIGVNGQICEEVVCTEDDGRLEIIDFDNGRTVRVVLNSDREEEILADDAKGTFTKEMLPQFDATYYDVKAQEDGIYLFNQEGGIIRYSDEDGTSKALVSKEDLKFAGQDVRGAGFLDDGRIMVLIISETESKIEIIPYRE